MVNKSKNKFLVAASMPCMLTGCENKSMNGIDDGLTVIGIIIAIMAGAYYLIKKIWMKIKEDDPGKE